MALLQQIRAGEKGKGKGLRGFPDVFKHTQIDPVLSNFNFDRDAS